MNLGLNYYGYVFMKNFDGVIRTMASYEKHKNHCVAAHIRFCRGA